jgi:hypothetical protein
MGERTGGGRGPDGGSNEETDGVRRRGVEGGGGRRGMGGSINPRRMVHISYL